MTISGYTGGGTVKITEGAVLAIAIMFEIPFLMVVLSWVLKYRANRWANIIAGTLFVVAQIGSLFAWSPISATFFICSQARNRMDLLSLPGMPGSGRNPEAQS